MDYLIEEVLNIQSEEVRDFLLQTSILYRLSGPLCDAVRIDSAENNSQAILERVSRLPLSTWNAKGTDPNVVHLGPMAQDFYAVFGLGDDEKSIHTIDLDGVALAAIQGLHQLVKEKDAAHAAEIQALRREIEKLKN